MSEPTGKVEQVFYERDGVRVTSARFQVGAQTYAMSSVNSVAFQMRPPNSGWPMFVLITGLLSLLIGIAMISMGGWHPIALVFLAPGSLMAGWAFTASAKAKPTYVVALTTSSGQVQALENTDRASIESVVRALNEALVSRG